MRYGLLIDLKTCFGCNACSIICKQKNATPPDIFWSRVEVKETGEYPNVSREFQPKLCMQCANPPCLDACTYAATYIDEKGLVQINQNSCAGCLYCVAACPYGARFFYFQDQAKYFPGQDKTAYEKENELTLRPKTVSKCNFCTDRLNEGDIPACVQTCPSQARIFGDLDSAEMRQMIIDRGGYQERAELNTNSSVYYLPK